MQKPSNARGTRDFGPKEMAKRTYVFNVIKNHFEQFGFQAIETPAIENLSTLTGKYGDEGDQLLFKILNSGDYLSKLNEQDFKEGSKKFTNKVSEKGLRYDLTVPFARFVSMNRNDLAFPFRRFQMQPVWRADRPQKGRYREFYQCDADIVGSNSLLNEAELITLFQSVFNSLRLKAHLVINSRKVLAGVVDVLGMSDLFVDFAVAIDKLDKIGWDAVSNELVERGFSKEHCAILADLIVFEGNNLAKIDKLRQFFNGNEQGEAGLREIEQVLDFISKNGYENSNIIFDYRLARGLSYYTGLIFEGKAKDIPFGSIAGGGRYDNLTSDFGLPNMSGVGLSFGIERIIDVMEALSLFPDIPVSGSKVLFAYFDQEGQIQAFQYVNELRRLGIASEIYPEIAKIKKPFEFADKKKIPFVAVLGEQELAENKINLKNMRSGEQKLLTLNELIQSL